MTARYTKSRVVYLLLCVTSDLPAHYIWMQNSLCNIIAFFFNTCIGIIIILITEGAIITEERSIVGETHDLVGINEVLSRYRK